MYKALLALFFSGCVYIGLPVVSFYHQVRLSPFLNVSTRDARGIERLADQVFAPVHYLLDGKAADFSIREGKKCSLKPRFSYEKNLELHGCLSILAFYPSLILGSFLKGVALLDAKVREKYHMIRKELASTEVVSNLRYYENLGISFCSKETAERLIPLGYEKKREKNAYLDSLKESLKSILLLLEEQKIPYWADCGTLLGAYRYGGIIPWDLDVDIAILLPDFENVKNILKKLDSKKCLCEDWSNRTRPSTYLRVYIKDIHQHIDIYGFSIDKEKRRIQYILSNEVSDFLTDSWKKREKNFTRPHSYEEVFPLKRAKFDDLEIWVPKDTKAFLQKEYGQDLRPAKIFDPATGEYKKDETHPYWKTHGE